MTLMPTRDYLERFSAALVSEIKAEMGRRELTFRGLATLLGENPQYVTSRLGAGNPRTGKRVEVSVRDLLAIASAFNMDAQQLLDRAFGVAGPIPFWSLPSDARGVEAMEDDLSSDRDSAPLRHLRAARKPMPRVLDEAARQDEGD